MLLVAAYWRTNLTMRQLGPLFGASKSAADRVIHHITPLHALAPLQRRHPADTVLIVDGTLTPTRDRSITASNKNHRYSTSHQVVIDANTRLVMAAGPPLSSPRPRNGAPGLRARHDFSPPVGRHDPGGGGVTGPGGIGRPLIRAGPPRYRAGLHNVDAGDQCRR